MSRYFIRVHTRVHRSCSLQLRSMIHKSILLFLIESFFKSHTFLLRYFHRKKKKKISSRNKFEEIIIIIRPSVFQALTIFVKIPSINGKTQISLLRNRISSSSNRNEVISQILINGKNTCFS